MIDEFATVKTDRERLYDLNQKLVGKMIIDKEDCKHILRAFKESWDQGTMTLEEALLAIRLMDKYNGLNDNIFRECYLRVIARKT